MTTTYEEDDDTQRDLSERLRAIGIANAWLGRATGRRWRGNDPEQALLLWPPHTLYGSEKWAAVWFAPDNTSDIPSVVGTGSSWAIALTAALMWLLPNEIEALFYAHKESGRYHCDWIDAE